MMPALGDRQPAIMCASLLGAAQRMVSKLPAHRRRWSKAQVMSCCPALHGRNEGRLQRAGGLGVRV